MNECIVCKSNDLSKIVRNKLPMFECSKCNLVWRQEFDVSMTHYEGKDVGLGEDKLNARIRNVKDRIKFIEKYLEPNNLCDIGAGEGTFLSELKKKEYKNIIGIEPNKEAVSFAKSRGINIFEGTINEASHIIKNNNIHTVTLFHVIEHLEDPRKAVATIYEALPKGGYLVIETPNIDAYTFRKLNFQHKLVYPEHFFYFNRRNLTQLLEETGFRVKAKGKRGFDQHNISIREALFCLSIGKSPFTPRNGEKGETTRVSVNKVRKDSLFRILLRITLNRLVLYLGRVDYQWVIVQK